MSMPQTLPQGFVCWSLPLRHGEHHSRQSDAASPGTMHGQRSQLPFNRPRIAHNAYVSAAGVSSSAAKATIWRPCCRCCSQPLSELPERHFSRSIELVDRSEFGNGFEELAQRLTASTSSQEPIAEPQLPLTESSRPQSGTAEEEPNPASTARVPLVQPQALPCARCASHALHLMQWQLGDIIICHLLQR